MLIGTLALTGFPLTAGYFSKDAIIEAAAAGHNPFAQYAFAMTVVAALLTSFYSWRLILVTFHGTPARPGGPRAAHESPWVILIPLIFLAVGSILSGLPFKDLFAGEWVDGVLPRLAHVRAEQPHPARYARVHFVPWVRR